MRQVLVTEACDIAEEYYISFLLDRTNRTFLAMASAEGGIVGKTPSSTALLAREVISAMTTASSAH